MLKALITGGAGFIGSHLAEKLLALGHHVIVLDDLSTGSIQNIKPLKKKKNFQSVIDSVMNASLVRELVDEADVVYHLAAAVGVRLIVDLPVHTITTNIRGTENVLAAAETKRKKVVLASTSEVYGKSDKVPFSEEDDMVLGPTTRSRWSYACSKAIDEFLALAYWKENKLPTTIVRLFNTIGPRQTGQYGMVVPRFVNQALANKPITVYGDGTQTRVFSYISDIVQALVTVGKSSKANGQIFNLGGFQETSILELAQKIKKLSFSRSKIQMMDYSKAYQKGFEDLNRRVPDISKAKKIIGFRPKVKLDQGLRKIIESVKRDRP